MRIKSPCATCLILHLFFRSIPLCSCSFLPLHVMSLALGFSFIMTKRDSCLAGFTSSRAPMSMPRRHSRFQGQPSSGATSSGQRPHPSSITDDLTLFHSFLEILKAALRLRMDIQHHLSLCLCPMTLPIRLHFSRHLKKPTHSRRRSNNGIERSILTSSQRFGLLKRETETSW